MRPTRRSLVLGLTSAGIFPSFVRAQQSATTGVTATEIRIGSTVPLSGPAAAYGVLGAAMDSYFSMVNDAGGINGRKVKLIVADDAFTPNRTLEQTRRLVESERVLFMLGQVGSSPALAARQYLNDAKVPQLFIASGAPIWLDEVKKYPWSLAFPPSYVDEGRSVAKHILANKPSAKVGVLFQNDDSGRAFIRGFREGFSTNPTQLVKEQSTETADPTVDSQIIALHGAGADVLVSFTLPKHTSQAIRRVSDLQWRPQIYVGSNSTSVQQALAPAGLDKAKGVISAAMLKDPSDASWSNDKGMQDFLAMMKKYHPEAALENPTTWGATTALLATQLLKQCGRDVTRERVLEQTMNLDVAPPLLLPGLVVKTSAQERSVLSKWRLQQFDGTGWKLMSN